MSDETDDIPLDDFLTMARTCGKVLAEDAAEAVYRRLMKKTTKASADWGLPEPARWAALKAYSEEYRKVLRS
jgi:hypothetical protein